MITLVHIALTRFCDNICHKLSIILGLKVTSLPVECFIAYAEIQEVHNRSDPPSPSAKSTPGNSEIDSELGTWRHGGGAGLPVVPDRYLAASYLPTFN
jgi:hypothetical protein